MSITREKSSKPTLYAKHHSFENFYSRLGTDINGQQARVIRLLTDNKTSDAKCALILDKALTELSDGEKALGLFRMTSHIADELSKIDDAQVPRYIFHRYRYDVLPKLKELDDYPPYLQIEPTSICNYRCVFCYQSDKSFANKTSGFMGTMTLELFKDVIDQIKGKVDFISLASRGEPTANPQLDKMLEYCRGKFLGLKLNTNASLLTEKLCHAILSESINTVVFSADAAEEPLYSQMRVGGKLDNVLKRIDLFNRIKAKEYSKSKIISRVSGVKYQDSQEMTSMKKTWGELVDQIAFVAYNPWENVYEAPANALTEPCSDLWRRMFVWYDGKVNPCDTDYKSLLTVGNVTKTPISKLWRSSAYTSLREKHAQKMRSGIFPCRGCVVV